MGHIPLQPVKDPPNLIRSGTFALDRLLNHTDPGPQEESEEFVRRIYEQRHIDHSSDRKSQLARLPHAGSGQMALHWDRGLGLSWTPW
jgi:hypothetical protein